jgi:DNA-binding NarL/FixJ family response regulator
LAIVFLTNFPDSRIVGRDPKNLPKGASYLRKSSLNNIETLVETLDATLRGMKSNQIRQDQDPNRPLGQLTQKQLDVLGLAAEGLSNAQIAERRGVSIKAIEDTLSRAATALAVELSNEGNVRVAAVRRFLAATKGEPATKSIV